MSLNLIDTKSLKTCKMCWRLTANAGGVCTRCLNGGQPTRRQPVTRKFKREVGRKYSDERVKEIMHVYAGYKARRIEGAVTRTAQELGMTPSAVQHVLTYYKSQFPQPT